jgi:hypothetical protein
MLVRNRGGELCTTTAAIAATTTTTGIGEAMILR